MKPSLLLVGLLVLIFGAGCGQEAESTAGDDPASSVTIGPEPVALQTVVVEGTGTARPLTEDELSDTTAAARATGQDPAEAVKIQTGWAELIAFRDAMGPQTRAAFVAYGRLDGARAGDSFLVFTGQPDEPTMTEIKKLPGRTEVRIGAPYAEKELATFTQALQAELRSVWPRIPPQIVPNATSLDVTYGGPVKHGPLDEEALRGVYDRAVESANLGDLTPVVFKFDPDCCVYAAE